MKLTRKYLFASGTQEIFQTKVQHVRTVRHCQYFGHISIKAFKFYWKITVRKLKNEIYRRMDDKIYGKIYAKAKT